MLMQPFLLGAVIGSKILAMATLKSEIKKAITNNSTKYIATKVWKIKVSENLAEECTMWIEVSVKKRKKKRG